MKFSEETLGVIKNFSTINQSILFKKGEKKLATISPQKSVIAYATIPENIPQEFAVYDLNQFLAVIGMFEDPEYKFTKDHVQINGDGASQTYRYTDTMLVTAPPETVKMPEAEVTFTLKKDDLQKVVRAANVNTLPEITFRGKKQILTVEATDSTNSSANSFLVELADIAGPTDFTVIFKLENMKMFEQTYEVSLTPDVAHFDGGDIEYYIAPEKKSKIGDQTMATGYTHDVQIRKSVGDQPKENR